MKPLRVFVFALAFVVTGTVASGSAGAADQAADKEIAQVGTLVAADFPAGWTSSPSDDSGDAQVEKVAKKLRSCKGYLALRSSSKKQPRAESPEFALDDSQIDNSVTVFPTAAAATSAIELFDSPSVPSCINKLFTALIKSEIAKDPASKGKIDSIDVDVTRADVAQVADGTVAYEGSVTLTPKSGAPEQIGVGNAAVRVGRAVTAFSYVIASSEALDLLPGLVDASVARLDTALA